MKESILALREMKNEGGEVVKLCVPHQNCVYLRPNIKLMLSISRNNRKTKILLLKSIYTLRRPEN